MSKNLNDFLIFYINFETYVSLNSKSIEYYNLKLINFSN